MAVISFFMDNREGHLLPSLWLAGELAAAGHRIIYYSTPDNAEAIQKQGFDFRAIFADIYPRGFNRMAKLRPDMDRLLLEKRCLHLSAMLRWGAGAAGLPAVLRGGEEVAGLSAMPCGGAAGLPAMPRGGADGLPAMLQEGRGGLPTKGGLFIGSSFLTLELLLLYYKYGINPVLFTAYMRAAGTTPYEECIKDVLDLPGDIMEEILVFACGCGIRPTSLNDLLGPLRSFPELKTCPPGFDPDEATAGPNVHYIGPCIRRDKKGGTPDLLAAAGTRKIIYCSLGSYAVSYGEACGRFYRILLNVMRLPSCAGLHLVLATGTEYDRQQLGAVPENATVVAWAPQLEMLAVSSLCITHGGLGTLQESIYLGVPMLVFPIRYDQPGNAVLIRRYGIGIMGDILTVNEEELIGYILQISSNAEIGTNVKKMQRQFREAENLRTGVRIVEGLARENVS